VVYGFFAVAETLPHRPMPLDSTENLTCSPILLVLGRKYTSS